MKACTRFSVAIGSAVALAVATPASPAVAAPAVPSTSVSTAASVGSVPTDWSARLEAAAATTGVERSPATEVVRQAIDPGVHQCGLTQLAAYQNTLLAGLDDAELEFLLASGVLDFPMFDALLFGDSADPAYAPPRAHRQDLSGTFRDAQRFWDVSSGDVQLLSVRGSVVLQDRPRLARLLETLYGLAEAEATEYADIFVTTVAGIPELRGGDNPIFALNALAFTADGATDPLIAAVPDKILFGSGISEFFHFAGLSDVGTRAILAHEFAHHVQFEQDLFDSPLVGAEATRRTELMADAMAGYFATHSRGASLNAKRVLQAQQSFFQVGDCSFESDGHHGTPLQRAGAARWGADLASSAQKQGHVLPSRSVAALFEAALPGLVAPDAG